MMKAMSNKHIAILASDKIWTFLERITLCDSNRVNAEPLDANIIHLSSSIGSLDLESAGDALVTWGVSYRDRAIQLLDEWQLKSPLAPVELVEPFYDGSLFDDLVLGRMEWDLGDLVETIEADYPTERQEAPKVISPVYVFGKPMKLSICLVILPTQTMSNPVANGSSVPAWPTFIFLSFDILRNLKRILLTTSNEVQPLGLSIKKKPPFSGDHWFIGSIYYFRYFQAKVI